ncbi:MAG: hypothetical protein KKA67_11615 [Spirochaetes bacterium]|nr:hypothetical protein [Spirochaetota bacterium]MBU1080379.1 hypothetical protein [Spirochaetota bacterium]
MDTISIVLVLFIVLECLNVILLYKMPSSTKGNAIGVFKAYGKAKADPEIGAMVDYLVNWVAGTKLIFIVLLIGVIITGSPATKVFSAIALMFSIATFFSRLFPIIKRVEAEDGLTIRGYSRTLAIMIGSFIAVFALALVIFLIGYFRG